MASYCRIYQHRVLLHCWIACRHTPRIHIWFWSWSEILELFSWTLQPSFFVFFFVLYWYIFTTSNLQGIWSGMIGGICLQTLILIVVTSLTNWRKEVSIFTLLHSLFHFWSLKLFIVFIVETESNLQAEQAESRVKKWGGSTGEHWSLFRRVTSLLRDHWQLDTCTTVLSNFRGVKYYVTPSSWITHHCAIFRSAFGHSILFCLGVLCTFKIF